MMRAIFCWLLLAAPAFAQGGMGPGPGTPHTASGGSHTCASCTLDGNAGSVTDGVASVTASLTTTQSSGIVVAACINASSTSLTLSSVTATSLTFTQFTGATISASQSGAGGTTTNNLQVYWAPYSASFAAKTITFNFSGSIGDASCVTFGIAGAGITTPLDASGVTTKSGNYSSTAKSTGTANVTTTNANDFIISIIGDTDQNAATAGNIAGTTATLIQNQPNGGGAFASTLSAEYRLVSATQASQSTFFNGTTTNTFGYLGITMGIQGP